MGGAFLALPFLLQGAAPLAKEYLVYAGTYTGPKSQGIYAYRFDTETGKMTPLGLAAETVNPTFLDIHPNHHFLYAINEIGNLNGKKVGGVSAFAIDAATGKLRLLNQQSSGGDGPCHVMVDKAGKNLLVANYGGGSVASLPIKPDGSVGEMATFVQHQGSGPNKERQAGPHGHCFIFDPANKFALACDLGLDQVLVYKFDGATGKVTPNDPPFGRVPAGAGPRHLSFHPNGKFVYVINELDSTMSVFTYDSARGALAIVQTVSTLPAGFSGNNSCAEVEVHPNGKFVYGSNRGHNSIAVFAIDEASGRIQLVENKSTEGKTPRHFTLDPTGKFLLAENQDSGTIALLKVDAKSGRLTSMEQTVSVGSPVCLKFVPLN